jgi:hypothetical protein
MKKRSIKTKKEKTTRRKGSKRTIGLKENLKITSHWFDSSNSLIGVTLAYADTLDLNFGDRSTFSILADGHSELTGIPKSVELSYDWQ